MRWGDDNHDLVREKRLGHMRNLLRGSSHDDEINLVVHQAISRQRAVGDLQIDSDTGILLLKCAEQ